MRWSMILAGLGSALAFSPAFSGTQDEYRALRAWCVQRDLHRSDAAWQASATPTNHSLSSPPDTIRRVVRMTLS